MNRITLRLSGLVPDIVCPNGLSDPTELLHNTLSVGLKGVRSDKLLSDIVLSVSTRAES